MASIKAIDKESVARICSGQVITDLGTAVKELVENSIDAGATHVEVKLREFGLDLIEVSDNGSGVPPHNYEGLALKYHTSKLTEFNDLKSIASFGFRGEALSSLCELAGSFVVTTRTADQAVGVKLTYNRAGKLVSKDTVPRPPGTTVSIGKLFSPLPVRQGEFKRNIKKQYNRLLRVLQGYALICVGVRLTVTNTMPGKQPSRLIATQRNARLEDNVANRRITGLVSKAGEGVGRSDTERQFTFLNGRPVELPKVTRVLNEVWRQYEMKNKPAAIVNVQLPPGDFDVNVTPDKREVFVTGEAALLEALKAALHELWSPSRYTFAVNQAQQQTTLADFLQRPGEDRGGGGAVLGARGGIGSAQGDAAAAATDAAAAAAAVEVQAPEQRSPQPARADALSAAAAAADEPSAVATAMEVDGEGGGAPQSGAAALAAPNGARGASPTSRPWYETGAEVSGGSEGSVSAPAAVDWSADDGADGGGHGGGGAKHGAAALRRAAEAAERRQQRRAAAAAAAAAAASVAASLGAAASAEEGRDADAAAAALARVLSREDFPAMRVVGQFNLGFVIARLRGDLFIVDQHAADEKRNYERLRRETVVHQQPLVRALPLEATAAEEAVIADHLDLFARNGFALSVEEGEPAGRRLRLTAVPFSKGAQFGARDVHELASIVADAHGSRARIRRNPHFYSHITRAPESHTYLHTHTPPPHTRARRLDEIRLPKLHAMFAMRACRSSIMVGTALDAAQMGRLVAALAGVEQPWNCPHGRPTLRHLADVSRSLRSEED
ncbi:hypothetical protein JKP88DRAFT_259047 [Tribonema minus]|uniref:Uncharacterized protein n=1 Tax=Tribonema minus TaxID=303371 RepID=A0A835YM26_9STRA|nr:hypothetical protein JKP88DRAFT_259047 [Tribonema minus]